MELYLYHLSRTPDLYEFSCHSPLYRNSDARIRFDTGDNPLSPGEGAIFAGNN